MRIISILGLTIKKAYGFTFYLTICIWIAVYFFHILSGHHNTSGVKDLCSVPGVKTSEWESERGGRGG